jgi:hypothetical protein
MKPSSSSFPRRIAGACAITLAVSVVVYLVWRAQSTTQSGRAIGDGLPSDASSLSDAQHAGDSATPVFLPSSKQASPDTLLPSSKFAPPTLHSIELLPPLPSLNENELIFSSKWGRPIAPEAKPNDGKNNQD